MKIDKNTKVLAFMNAFTQGKSGGDVAFIEIFKRLNFSKLTVVTSLLGKKLCEKSGLKAKYIVTTHEKYFGNVYYTYFKRILKAIIYIFQHQDFDLVYSSSDALPDVLSALLLKITHKKIKWMAKFYHLIPQTRPLPYFFQRISLLAANRYADIILNKGEFGFNSEMIDSVLPSPQKFDAVFMSRLHASKGIFDLIEMWKKIVIKLPNATLAVIGTGSKK